MSLGSKEVIYYGVCNRDFVFHFFVNWNRALAPKKLQSIAEQGDEFFIFIFIFMSLMDCLLWWVGEFYGQSIDGWVFLTHDLASLVWLFGIFFFFWVLN